MWIDVEKFSSNIEKLSDQKMSDHFVDEKYGSYYRNLNGIIEHAHYHLGQIILIKKNQSDRFSLIDVRSLV
ncbi:MAG: hypothetical protein ACI8XB_000508 [Patiriisocius sp.]|jgi:hypothetical protein